MKTRAAACRPTICGRLSNRRAIRFEVSLNDTMKILHCPMADLDLVVAAGGDGTVATAAGIAARTSTALAILPLGTANNIATSLGVQRAGPRARFVVVDSSPHALRSSAMRALRRKTGLSSKA